MRKYGDFMAMHYVWRKQLLNLGLDMPKAPYKDCPIEMTVEEQQMLLKDFAITLKYPTDAEHIHTLLGHPVIITWLPRKDISLPHIVVYA